MTTKWKIVPVDPTEEMINAGENKDRPAAEYSGYSMEYADCERHYAAMLAASPKASEDEALVENVAEAIWKCKYGPGNRMAAERIARAVLKMLENET